MILSARWLLPMDAPPISWGAVCIDGDRIRAVGPRDQLLAEGTGESNVDLGNAILLPGLVNAHCHLDYTLMRAVGAGLEFNEWLMNLTRQKWACPPDFFLQSARQGAKECLRGGITTVGDCNDSGDVAQALHENGLRGISYPEVFGMDDRDPLENSLAYLSVREERQRPWLNERVKPGISPHAPYSVSSNLFAALNDRSKAETLPLMIHLAESVAEVQFLLGQRPWKSPKREGAVQCTPPGQRPVPYLESLGLLREGNTFIHCLQVTKAEIQTLAESGAGVVTCPRSNIYLGNGIPALRAMLDCGVRLGIGTDGACSSGPLSLFEEMRAAWFLAQSHGQEVSCRELVEMATVGGARALFLDEEIGTLTPGKAADVTALSLDSPSMQGCEDPYTALVLCATSEAVLLTMVAGKPIWDPQGLFSGPCGHYAETYRATP